MTNFQRQQRRKRFAKFVESFAIALLVLALVSFAFSISIVITL